MRNKKITHITLNTPLINVSLLFSHNFFFFLFSEKLFLQSLSTLLYLFQKLLRNSKKNCLSHLFPISQCLYRKNSCIFCMFFCKEKKNHTSSNTSKKNTWSKFTNTLISLWGKSKMGSKSKLFFWITRNYLIFTAPLIKSVTQFSPFCYFHSSFTDLCALSFK